MNIPSLRFAPCGELWDDAFQAFIYRIDLDSVHLVDRHDLTFVENVLQPISQMADTGLCQKFQYDQSCEDANGSPVLAILLSAGTYKNKALKETPQASSLPE